MIIGLHGAKQSGKDSFFEIAKPLIRGRDVRKIAFADPIKQEISFIFQLQDELAYDNFKTNDIILPSGQIVPGRHVVREIGMLMRSYDSTQFVEYVKESIMSEPDVIWFITDVRFRNEIEMLRRLGGVLVKIVRPSATYDGHVSEQEIEDSYCDYVINNDSSFDEYRLKVIDIVNGIKESIEYETHLF